MNKSILENWLAGQMSANSNIYFVYSISILQLQYDLNYTDFVAKCECV